MELNFFNGVFVFVCFFLAFFLVFFCVFFFFNVEQAWGVQLYFCENS